MTGFTIIEMMLVIAVVAILALLGVYGLAPLYAKNSVKGAAVLISNTYAFAKLEAARQKNIVYICPANISTNDVLSSCMNNTDMSGGLLVYARYYAASTYVSSSSTNTGNRLKLIKFSSKNGNGGLSITAKNKLDTLYPNGTYMPSLYDIGAIYKKDPLYSSQVIQVSKDSIGITYYACIYINPLVSITTCYKGDPGCNFPCV